MFYARAFPLCAGLVILSYACFSPATMTLVADAVYQTNGDVTSVTIPSGSCASVTASPIQVGDFIVWANHDRGQGGNCTASPYKDALLGYNVKDGKLYLLARNGSSEATLLYQPEAGRVFQNIVFGGTVSALDANTFQKVASLPRDFRATSDASGVYLNGLYYFGTINTPEAFCQNPVNENCGGVFAMDANGNIVNTLNVQDHFRSWIGAGLTTDGQYIYVGGSPHWLGATEPQGYYGCSVVKLDPQLNILASFDPGDPGCHHTGAQRNDEDAVAGEVVIAPDGSLWVTYAHAVDSRNMFSMYHLDANLQQICVFELQGGPLSMVGYYQSPTIDKDGNVYVNLSPNGIGQNSTGQLWKVTPACQGTQLATLTRGGTSTPVLADDQYILTIAAGELQIRDLSGNVVKTYALASGAQVFGSPMIADGVMYIVDATGSLTVIQNSGLQGYGTAAWPRYRHDNYGSGMYLPETSCDQSDRNIVRDTEQILNWAESAYAGFFPSHQTTREFEVWLYRYYPETGIYAGVNRNDEFAYVLGGPFGNSPVRVKRVNELLQEICSN